MDGFVDFFFDWVLYKKGFGNLRGEFWLGNDNFYCLIVFINMLVWFDMEDYEGDWRYVEYMIFVVVDESNNYWLMVDGYCGMVGDVVVFFNKLFKYVVSINLFFVNSM